MFSLPYRSVLSAFLVGVVVDTAAATSATSAHAIPAARSMYRQADTGWLERDVYRSPADAGVAVQFLDVLVGAGREARVRDMPTGALLDVKAGAAVVTVDQLRTRSAPGMVIPIDQGQVLSIDNREGDRAFVARLIHIASPR